MGLVVNWLEENAAKVRTEDDMNGKRMFLVSMMKY